MPEFFLYWDAQKSVKYVATSIINQLWGAVSVANAPGTPISSEFS
jgi:hypothetical protein